VNFHSQHSLPQKKSIIFRLVRTLFLSHPKFHEKNLENVIDTLLNNHYSLPFIFSIINTRIKMLSHRTEFACNNNDKTIDQQPSNKDYFIVPYVNSISENFLPIARRFGFHMAYSVPSTLNRFIKRGKDKIEFTERMCL